jgi:exodeoxyribonuclease V gamma subunit
MPSVFPYTSANKLLEELISQISGKLSESPLKPVKVVVPSVYFRDWLQVQLARRLGICMGLEFSMPQDFVKEVFAAADIQKASKWSKRHLEWSVFEHGLGIPGLDAQSSVRDRFAMSCAVADRLDQYAHFRPEMLSRWMQGHFFLKNHDDRTDEAWQRTLWEKLFQEFGNDPCLLPERLQTPEVSAKLEAAFSAVTVIGSGSLDPLLLDILGILSAAEVPVDAHIILPCLGYLADIRQRNLTAPSPESDPQSFEMDAEARNNPLLVSMARHAVGAFVLLGEKGDEYANWPDLATLQAGAAALPGNQSLLRRIQEGVRANEDYVKVDGLAADESLRIHACYGPRRELEVLRDELLRAFAEIDDLKPEEVLVAVPSLDKYAPLVSAVFYTKENPLPVRLTELPASEGDEVLEGLLALLELARGGRGRASEVLDFMQLRAVREALGVGDDEEKLEALAAKFRDSGITQGFAIGQEHPGDWGFSINRLVAGEFFGPQEPEQSAESGFQLPVADSMGSNFSEMETFLLWLADLRSTLIEWQTAETPKQWVERLKQAAAALLAGEDGRMSDADKILRFLSELNVTTPVDAAVILDWMESETDEANRRASISGATPFGRLKQLHNTPCRVLALVGMQNDNFPSRTTAPSWDLLRTQPKIWDRNARVDDRQMFLDAVLAPTERLIITASTQNIRTNKSQPFSTCVDELLAAAHKLGVDRKDLIHEHPLQPFSKKYFKDAGNLQKPLGAGSARLAEKIHCAEKTKSPLWSGEVGAQPSNQDEISVASLVAFWKDPAKAYLKAQGVAVPFDEDDDRELDRSMLSTNHLDGWKIKDAIMEEWIEGDGNMHFVKASLLADRSLPVGELGQKTWDTLHAIVEPIATQVASVKGSHLELEVLVEIEGQSHKVTGSVLRNADVDVLIAYRAGKIDDAKYFLEPWIKANLASAADHALPTVIFDEDSSDATRIQAPIPPTEARERLKILVAGFLQGQGRPLCYAPITSDKLIDGNEKAATEWEREDKGHGGGEGQKAASRLAWRDRDAFENIDDWLVWKDAVAQPLKAWGGF